MKEKLNKEIQDIVGKCIKCGMCKSLCPVFKTILEEQFSPRGKAILLNEKILNEIVFKCNLCGACKVKCPLNLELDKAFRNAREVLVLEGKELEENKEMIKNIREFGNPFGKVDKGKTPDKLYCC